MSDFTGNSESTGMRMMFESIRRQQKTSIDARRAETRETELTERFDRLVLISMAMWSFLSEKTGIPEEQLMERVKQIDLMDGVADGKLRTTVAQCPKCGRVMAPRHTKCIYCGAEKLRVTAFDEVL